MVCAIARLDEDSPLDLSQYFSSIPELLKVYREQKMDMDFLGDFLGDVKVQKVQKLPDDFGWENINGNQESR
jgi:tryptophanase